MDKIQIKSIIEAILFAWSEPISTKELSKTLTINTKEIESVLKEMIDDFNYNKRGIEIIKMNDYYQLATRPEYYPYIRKLLEPKQSKGLTQAALETLAIVAYKQPITKGEVEEIRGVKCDKAISTLMDKDLISEQGRLERIGRPILYGTTVNFLKSFGLKTIEDLPDMKELIFDNEETDDIKDIYNK
ncbi:MAG: SMC-Scp complex subunit ScpB [Clostridiaceae bacterium]|nr:SMC-Scp complex subunit ScpB [Clostridiaceae bacterium]